MSVNLQFGSQVERLGAIITYGSHRIDPGRIDTDYAKKIIDEPVCIYCGTKGKQYKNCRNCGAPS